MSTTLVCPRCGVRWKITTQGRRPRDKAVVCPTCQTFDDVCPPAKDAARGVCQFCKGRPVGDAASWRDGKPRPPLPCPRCGEVYEEAT